MTHPINYQVMPGLNFKDHGFRKVENIFKLVSEYYGISEKNIKSKLRTRHIAYPRHVCMYLLRKFTGLPLYVIGDMFKGEAGRHKHYSTVINAVQNIKDLIQTDDTIAREIREIELKLM